MKAPRRTRPSARGLRPRTGASAGPSLVRAWAGLPDHGVGSFPSGLRRRVVSPDAEDVLAEDLTDGVVGMPALDHADGVERPVGPREALDSPGSFLVVVHRPEVLPARPGEGERRSAVLAPGHLRAFGCVIPRRVGDVGPDRDVFGPEPLHGVIDVIE